MPTRALLCLIVTLLASPAPSSEPVRHVVVVVVDGLRPDAVAAAPAPQMQALAARGATGTARALEIPETLPSFVTMATGLPPSLHGVTWNDHQDREYAGETMFTRVHGAGRRTALYAGKSKIVLLAPRGSADVFFGATRDKTKAADALPLSVATRFAADFAREPPALALVHIREPDYAGHDSGWMSEPYLAAVREADDAVGIVLRAIDRSPGAGATAVLLTADHGGEGDSHGTGRGETSWIVPFICRVPGPGGGTLGPGVTLADVAPTALALLRLPALAKARGQPVAACLPARTGT